MTRKLFNPRTVLMAIGFATGMALAIPMAAIAQSSVSTTYGNLTVTATGVGSLITNQTRQGIETRLNDDLVIVTDDTVIINGEAFQVAANDTVVIDSTDGFTVTVDGVRIFGLSELDVLIADAEAGDPASQNDLAVRYRNGEGVEVDHARAMELYLMAAEQGLDIAQSNAAFGYWTGNGVENDDAAAAHWAALASAQGNVIATRLLGLSYFFGRGNEVDKAEAARLWAEAANGGDATSALNMGIIVRDGDGVQQDRDLAILWFQRAAELGHPDAEQNLSALEAE